MTKIIPREARILLDFIYLTETGLPTPACYEVIYGRNEGKLPVALTKMTISEVQSRQREWSRRFGSSAAGAPQFIAKTLAGLRQELEIHPSRLFDARLQDELAYRLLERRGFSKFMSGGMDRTEFGKRLAQEWASFPVLATCKGATRRINRGQSYYAGDGQNKALVSPEAIEALLDRIKRPESAGPGKGANAVLGVAAAGAVAAAASGWDWLVDFFTNLFGG